MEKKYFLATVLLCLLLNFKSFSQDKLSFSEVIQTDSVGIDIIYSNLLQWVSDNYKNPDKVIQINEKSSGLLVINGVFEYSYGGLSYLCYEGYINYSIKIQIKDNRYKVEIYNFKHEIIVGNSSSCELGIITTAENFSETGMQKKI